MGNDEDDAVPADAGRRPESFDRELTPVEGALTLVGTGVAPRLAMDERFDMLVEPRG